MIPGNYTTHLIEDNLTYLGQLEKMGPPLWGDAKFLSGTLKLMATATKFILPEGGYYVDWSDPTKKELESIRLPYPVVTLEFAVGKGVTELKPGQKRSSQRVLVCFEQEKQGRLGFNLISFARNDEDKSWAGSPMVMFYPYDNSMSVVDKSEVPPDVVEMMGEQAKKKSSFTLFEVVCVTPMQRTFEVFAQRAGRDLASFERILALELGQDLGVVLEFLNVLNCANVEIVKIEESKALNKKRARQGKIPFFEYKQLMVRPGKSYVKGKKEGILEAWRNSPRQHLRRGHIRRLQKGTRIWVTSHLVGDPQKGRVEKEYRMFTPTA